MHEDWRCPLERSVRYFEDQSMPDVLSQDIQFHFNNHVNSHSNGLKAKHMHHLDLVDAFKPCRILLKSHIL